MTRMSFRGIILSIWAAWPQIWPDRASEAGRPPNKMSKSPPGWLAGWPAVPPIKCQSLLPAGWLAGTILEPSWNHPGSILEAGWLQNESDLSQPGGARKNEPQRHHFEHLGGLSPDMARMSLRGVILSIWAGWPQI